MIRSFPRLGLVSLAILAGLPATAQTATTGALLGTVKDAQGAPLVGATVRAVSGQISRSVVTGADGSFRLPLLNPGVMDLSVVKSGFTTLNQKVDVSINEAKTLNFKMVPEAEVTVVVAAQMVGVDTTTAQVGSNYSTETLRSVPMGRSMESFANLTPGVVDKGNMDGWDDYFGQSISGGSGAENSYVVDGLGTTDARYGGNGAKLVTDFIDQVEVQTGAFKPEYSALGGVFNVVTKSGSNEFKGSAWITWDPIGMFAQPKRTEVITQDNPLSRYDVGAEAGGALIKDRLFFFAGFDATIRKNDASTTNNLGLTGTGADYKYLQFIGKLNYFASENLQFTLAMNYSPDREKVDRDYSDDSRANNGFESTHYSRGTNLTMDWVLNDTMTLSAKVGRSQVGENYTPLDTNTRVSDGLYFYNGAADFSCPWGPGAGASQNRPAARLGIGGNGYFNDEKNQNDQFRLDFSWFKANHQIKAGYSRQTSRYEQVSYRGSMPQFRPDGTIDPLNMGGEITLYRSGGYGAINPATNAFAGHAVAQFYQEAYANGLSKANYDALYAQDTWDVGKGIKLMYGVRLENQALIDANDITYLKFGFKDCVQPRVGFIWDPKQDGQSKVTANFATYNEVFPLRYGMRYRGGRYQMMYTYRLVTNYVPATQQYELGGLALINPSRPWLLNPDDQAILYNDPPVQKDIKAPKRTEWVLGYERNLSDGWSVGTHATFRKLTNPVEDMNPVNIWDDLSGFDYADLGVSGNGQAILGNVRGGTFHWMTNPNSLSNTTPGVSQLITWQSNLPEGFNKYNAWDVVLSRQSERHFFSFSYTWSRLYGNYQGIVRVGQRDTNGSADYDLPTHYGYGPLLTDRTHVIKLQGSNTFNAGPGQLILGYSLAVQSGTPFTRYSPAYSDLGWTLPTTQRPSFAWEPFPADWQFGNTGKRQPMYQNLDLRVEYNIKVGKILVMPSLDIFNALNTRKATGYNQQYTIEDGAELNPEFGDPTAYRYGRNLRFGLKVRF